MSTQKKKAPAAQQLIDSLLDDEAPDGVSEIVIESSGPKSEKPREESFKDSVVFEIKHAEKKVEFELMSDENSSDEESLANARPVESEVPSVVRKKLEAHKLKPSEPKQPEPSDSDNEKTTVAPRPKRPQAQPPPEPKTDVVDRTLRLASENKVASTKETKPTKPVDRMTATDIGMGHQTQVARKMSAASGAVLTSAEAQLKQSESLRIAQSRISELEAELERLRRENEKLAAAGDTLRRRADELLAQKETADNNSRESEKIYDEEKKVFRGQVAAKDREVGELKQKLDEMEHRLESNFKKIRVRERELEHRLEIIKMESATLVSTKDKMILDLKRQIDQLSHEAEYSKQKSQEMYNQFKEKQETNRRVVRALRIALSILEGEDESNLPGKKAAE